jgi:hypothetical protein
VSNRQRRTQERKRALLGARIVFNNRSSVIDCTVRDLSEAGARLVLGHPLPLPSVFELEMPSKGQTRRCELRWAAGLACGVRFV